MVLAPGSSGLTRLPSKITSPVESTAAPSASARQKISRTGLSERTATEPLPSARNQPPSSSMGPSPSKSTAVAPVPRALISGNSQFRE